MTNHQDAFQIGPWVIRPDLNRISNENRSVQIEPKMMQVLVFMADHPGEVVSRQTLLEKVWNGTIVGEEVVSRSISELRKAMGDDQRPRHIIETISKSGYRLIAPVASGVDPDPVSNATKKQYGIGVGQRLSLPGKLGILLIVFIGMGTWFMSIRNTGPISLEGSIQPGTSFHGQEFDPALSPDGSLLAFVWTGPDNGHINIYIKMVESESIVRVTDGPLYEYSPTWSPDGQQIAFARSLHGLFVKPILGGAERKLIDLNGWDSPDVVWSPVGDVLVYTDIEREGDPYKLYVLDLESLSKRTLTDPQIPATRDSEPAISPDGKRVAFIRETGGTSDIYIVPVYGGEPERLTFDHLTVSGLGWTPDGNHIVYASNRGGGDNLWQISVQGGASQPVSLGAGDIKEPVLSKQGNRIAFTRSMIETNIWSIRIDPHVRDSAQIASRIIASTRRDANPQFSPDGKRIAFVSTRSGNAEIWISDSQTENPFRLTRLDGPRLMSPRWSPDGSTMAFISTHKGNADIYLMDVEGGPVRQFTDDPFMHMAPAWARDGRSIYFASNRNDGWNVYNKPIGGGQVNRITQNGGFAAMESEDGKLLVFNKADTTGLWKIDMDDPLRTQTKIIDTLSTRDWENWTIRQDVLYYINRTVSPSRFIRMDLESGGKIPIGVPDQSPYQSFSGISVSPDGTRLLYTQLDHSSRDILITELEQ